MNALNRLRILVKIHYLSLLIGFVLFSACTETSDPQTSDNVHFGIYFLEDTTLTISDVWQTDIDILILQKTAWITEEDIEFYDFSSHCIYLKTDKSDYFNGFDNELYIIPVWMRNRPFIITTGETRAYLASFHSIVFCSMPVVPYIDEFCLSNYPDDVIQLSQARIEDDDARFNDDVREALIDLGLYHGGLEIELDTVEIIDNTDTATVEYTYTFTNEDSDDLWVIDPDRMGTALFHYFTNGVNFRSMDNNIHYWSSQKTVITPEPYDRWETDWFTKIPSGQSMTRTVRLRGYPRIQPGHYIGEFTLANPVNIDKDARLIDNGRIWIGLRKSSSIDLQIE